MEVIDYTANKTYAWAPLDNETIKNFSEKDLSLRNAFIDEANQILANRGFELVDSNKADLMVYARGLRASGYRSVGQTPSYTARYEPSSASSTWLAEASSGSGVSGTGYLKPETRIAVRFLITEAKSDKEAWKAKGMVRVDDSRSELLQREDARKLARQFLKGFPPKN